VEREIADAIAFAKASPAPSIEELTRYVYSD
jgi:pyruvate dehydrogenase E1 component alpha subunit